MKYEGEYIPEKDDKFVAVERKTGHKALAGGICKATKTRLADTGRCEAIEAVDQDGNKRVFIGARWRFLSREKCVIA